MAFGWCKVVKKSARPHPIVIVSPGDLGNTPQDYETEKIVMESSQPIRWGNLRKEEGIAEYS